MSRFNADNYLREFKGIAVPPVSFVDWSKAVFSRPNNFVASRRAN